MEFTAKMMGRFWLFYFISSIAILGSVFVYFLTAPLLLLGFRFPRVQRVGEQRMLYAVQLLLTCQPWLKLQSRVPAKWAQANPRGAPGCLFISNHRSHLDVFLLISRIQGLRVFARSSLFNVPFLGAMMRLTRQIPADRGRLQSFVSGMDMVRKRLSEGERVHIFPELARCNPGLQGTRSFVLAPFHAAIQEQVPVVPIVISGTDSVWPRGLARIHFRRPIQVLTLKPILPGEFQSAEQLRDEVKRRIDEVLLTQLERVIA
ncbi:MAG: 1-acyl-sn-glycerol-3-phosphate acyltransferase [Methylotenera sp.]|nr:1-acyl-sn-glycerol-3-phosphate acyltransferase [Oligoflexia bacterium]